MCICEQNAIHFMIVSLFCFILSATQVNIVSTDARCDAESLFMAHHCQPSLTHKEENLHRTEDYHHLPSLASCEAELGSCQMVCSGVKPDLAWTHGENILSSSLYH